MFWALLIIFCLKRNKDLKNIAYLIFTILLLFTVTYQDSFLSIILGEIGRSPAILFLPLIIVLRIRSREFVKSESFNSIYRVFKLFVIVYTIVSIINLIEWFTIGEKTLIFLNQNVILKSVKYGVYYLVFILLFKYGYFYFSVKVSDKNISISLLVLITFYSLFIIFELSSIPNAFKWLHANDISYLRIRMLTYESSWTGGIAILLFCCAMAFSQSFFSKFVCIAFILLFTLTSGSKQFLSVFPLAMFLASFQLKHRYKKSLLFSSVVVFLLTLSILIPILQEKFTEDLLEYSSTVTRSSAFINSFRVILFVQPIGTGGLYFYYIATYLRDTAEIIVDLIGFGVLHEVNQMGKDTDEFLTAGSSFAEWTLLGGYLGFVLYFLLLKRLYKISKANFWLLVGFFHFAITNTFSETMVTKVNWAIFFSLVCTFYDRKKKKDTISLA